MLISVVEEAPLEPPALEESGVPAAQPPPPPPPSPLPQPHPEPQPSDEQPSQVTLNTITLLGLIMNS